MAAETDAKVEVEVEAEEAAGLLRLGKSPSHPIYLDEKWREER